MLYLGWLPFGATPLSRGLLSGAGELDLDPAARAENHRRSKTFPVRHSSHRSRWRAASVSDRHRGRSGAGPRLGRRDGRRPPSRDMHVVVAGLSYSSPVADEPACAWNRRGQGALVSNTCGVRETGRTLVWVGAGGSVPRVSLRPCRCGPKIGSVRRQGYCRRTELSRVDRRELRQAAAPVRTEGRAHCCRLRVADLVTNGAAVGACDTGTMSGTGASAVALVIASSSSPSRSHQSV